MQTESVKPIIKRVIETLCLANVEIIFSMNFMEGLLQLIINLINKLV